MSDAKRNDGGSAFPVQWPDGVPDSGMTLRDWFAGKALAGWLAEANLPDEKIESLAARMYRIADAMLKARGES